MGKLPLLLVLCLPVLASAQTLDDVAERYIQPLSTTEELRQGLEQVDELCSTDETKCARARGFAHYLLSDDYFEATYNVLLVDAELAQPVYKKATELYEMAIAYLPLEQLTEVERNVLLESKYKLEATSLFEKLKGD